MDEKEERAEAQPTRLLVCPTATEIPMRRNINDGDAILDTQVCMVIPAIGLANQTKHDGGGKQIEFPFVGKMMGCNASNPELQQKYIFS